jgi:lipopolysaccharide/colanic/teichoic acid biosynthesis glycosyltransferase
MIKRSFDVAMAAFALLLSSPLLVAIALAIRVEGGGPILFRQERAGRGGRSFCIHKFRTMRPGPGAAVTSDTDSRITRVGHFLRASKLDELPQLYDVLIGHMSLVGPRPEVNQYVSHWPAAARRRILSVRPGITDPASVVYRNESVELAQASHPEEYYLSVVLPRKVEMYVRYVENRSFVGDLLIIARTMQAVVGR